MIIIYNHALDTKAKVEMMGGEDGDSLSILSSDSVHILAPSWVGLGTPMTRTRTQCFVIMMLPHKSFKCSRLDRFKERRYPNPR